MDLITLYEVLEHLTDPFTQLEKLAKSAPILLFTTELLPDPAPEPGSWWYYALESGQHISFYSPAALGALAARLGLEMVSDGQRMHAFYSPGSLPMMARALIRFPRAVRVMNPILRRARRASSLLERDFEAVRLASEGSAE